MDFQRGSCFSNVKGLSVNEDMKNHMNYCFHHFSSAILKHLLVPSVHGDARITLRRAQHVLHSTIELISGIDVLLKMNHLAKLHSVQEYFSSSYPCQPPEATVILIAGNERMQQRCVIQRTNSVELRHLFSKLLAAWKHHLAEMSLAAL